MENLSREKKNIKEKKDMKRSSFITQFKIEFLLPFTSCGKVLGKMPDIYSKLSDGDNWDVRKDEHQCQLSSLVGP